MFLFLNSIIKLFLLLLNIYNIQSAILNEKPFYPEKCHLIPSNDQLVFTNFNVSKSHRSNRDTQITPNLIIHSHYHESFNNLPKNIIDLYKNRLIPQAIKYWENSLRVKYRYFPIYLGRLCGTNQVYFMDTSKTTACESHCAKQTKCGDYIVIPEEHLDVCRYCISGAVCRESGVKSSGIHADFILYISAVNSSHCDISNTVAFASYCQLESKYNRPVAGYVNICPHSVSSKQSDIHSALATLKHEILHALGFSAGLYAFFLDSNGHPLTKRDSYTGKPKFNSLTNMYEASEQVVKTVMRPNWKINSKEITRNVTMIVTPRVVDEVRKHFNCSSLEGAELEDQGEVGTKYTHWEKRIFENEAMTGTYTQNSIFSRITFAFLEDTGWYYVNYSYAEDLVWGKNLGCDFVMKSCKQWIDDRQAKGLSIRPFCNNLPNSVGTTSKYECNSHRDAVLLCNLMKYTNSIPEQYRNFDSVYNHHRHDNHSLSHYGGSVVLADYCPFMQQVSWSINNDVIRDSKCTYEENRPDSNKNYVLEDYGHNSKCFLHNRTWHIYSDRCQSRITVSKTVGCYDYFCDTNKGLVVIIHNKKLVCSYKDQLIEFAITSKNKNVYFGNFICPSCEELCGSQIKCPIEQYNFDNNNNNNYQIQDSSLRILNSNSKYTHTDYQQEYCIYQLSKSTSNALLRVYFNLLLFLCLFFNCIF